MRNTLKGSWRRPSAPQHLAPALAAIFCFCCFTSFAAFARCPLLHNCSDFSPSDGRPQCLVGAWAEQSSRRLASIPHCDKSHPTSGVSSPSTGLDQRNPSDVVSQLSTLRTTTTLTFNYPRRGLPGDSNCAARPRDLLALASPSQPPRRNVTRVDRVSNNQPSETPTAQKPPSPPHTCAAHRGVYRNFD